MGNIMNLIRNCRFSLGLQYWIYKENDETKVLSEGHVYFARLMFNNYMAYQSSVKTSI